MNSTRSWPWPSCHKQPKTPSFGASNRNNTIFMATNSVYLEATESARESEEAMNSPKHQPDRMDMIEMMIQGLKSSKRLLFDPKGATRSILQDVDGNNKDTVDLRYYNQNKQTKFLFGESMTLVTIDSQNPFGDFGESMKEMMEAHGLRDWKDLEELLSWYLKFNGKNTHGYIFAAFLDLLVGDDLLGRPSATSCSCSLHQDSHSCTSCSSDSSCESSS